MKTELLILALVAVVPAFQSKANPDLEYCDVSAAELELHAVSHCSIVLDGPITRQRAMISCQFPKPIPIEVACAQGAASQ